MRTGDVSGVLAVDPTSPFSGGALLGDRIRMQDHATDEGVYIRSMASRGHLGGLSVAAPQALRVLDAAGCDVVLVETVGVGQSEVEISGLADTTLVLLAPGMGDGIQAAKAGILEIGDIFVVNKADREGAASTRRELRSVVAMSDRADDAWKPPVLLAVATTGEGVDDVAEQIALHHAHLDGVGRAGSSSTRPYPTRDRGPGAQRRTSAIREICPAMLGSTPSRQTCSAEPRTRTPPQTP